MASISNILKTTTHRPYPIPVGHWQYYQEWNKVIFLHYEVDFATLRKLVPKQLDLDEFQGRYYISIVPFTMECIRPRFLPAFPPISNFHEINIRTYVKKDGFSGVYFLQIESEKEMATHLAKKLSGLPYEKSNIQRKQNTYINQNKQRNISLHLEYKIGKKLTLKNSFDKWLTERYCLFLEEGKKIYRYDIQHLEWTLYEVTFPKCDMQYEISALKFGKKNMASAHYSDGVKVLSWKKILA